MLRDESPAELEAELETFKHIRSAEPYSEPENFNLNKMLSRKLGLKILDLLEAQSFVRNKEH